MRLDGELQQDVLDELRDDPGVDASQIGVTADNGVVTLSGFVCSGGEKHAAEEAAKRVYGTRAVANEVVVRLPFGAARTDADVARAALDVLRWDTFVPADRVTVTVDQGRVTLDGTVDTPHQKDQAEAVVRRLKGVADVDNRVRVTPNVRGGDVKHRITEAFRRNAELEARRISVKVYDGGKVTLEGCVNDWSEVREARRAAAAVPGVAEVESRLTVAP
jgi:osmotically-inducible protein OsmY